MKLGPIACLVYLPCFLIQPFLNIFHSNQMFAFPITSTYGINLPTWNGWFLWHQCREIASISRWNPWSRTCPEATCLWRLYLIVFDDDVLISHGSGSMGLVYLPTLMPQKSTIHVGKYTSWFRIRLWRFRYISPAIYTWFFKWEHVGIWCTSSYGSDQLWFGWVVFWKTRWFRDFQTHWWTSTKLMFRLKKLVV